MTNKAFRVVLAGGGTGGHIIPAIAVADEVVRLGGTVRFVGTEGRIEEKLVPQAGYGIDFIKVKPLAGGGPGRKISGLASAPVSVLKSAALLKRIAPSVVIGVGGYVAGPVVLAARLMGIPTALLEQNATIGLANKILKPVIKHAFVSYEQTVHEFQKGKAEFTGNPVKQQILDAAQKPKKKSNTVHILVMGGSQGAKTIDERVPEAIASAKLTRKINVVHQGQPANLTNAQKKYDEAKINAVTTPFIDDTAGAFRTADLVIARSGATTVAELTVMGLPAIFLPYPHHADKQQEKNAAPMRDLGAAIVIDEKTTGVPELTAAIEEMLETPDRLESAASASKKLGRPDAASVIASRLYEMAL
ncbi:MAG: undecaprenyldiphospho-muramoylpentapeptide beta-N-acetylglucosaminyltransferase [Deltaproteobacteria bacterium]|nr:undecaprenyldiphospho-muramoylpentapeptide beta-N-acetylglucosaminyltransferase [Deltaproteobacteria bacterium]MBN2673859.1 undecaprenyldiphospho-muramoylpentapeptide beta-N-acetylglucosaminyltransferase [Deltaproteobacteria bacterium]